MTRYRTDLDTASGALIAKRQAICNTVMRISALSGGQSKKAAFWVKILRQVAFMLPAKSEPTKRLAASKVADALGFHPTLAEPSRMATQINSPVSATTIRTRPRQSVGAKNDPLYGWLINKAECADGLIRLRYPSIVALTGERLCLGET
jgi:hypothetical protein